MINFIIEKYRIINFDKLSVKLWHDINILIWRKESLIEKFRSIITIIIFDVKYLQ